MADNLSSAGLAILSWGATYLIHSSLLVAGVGLFLWVRSGAGHQLRENLWKLALVGGVVTAPLQFLTTGGTLQRFTITFAQPDARPGRLYRQDQRTSYATTETDEHAGAIAESLAGLATFEGDAGAFEPAPVDSSHRSASAADQPSLIPAGPPADPASTINWSLQTVLTLGLAILSTAMLLGLARCLWQTLVLARKLSGSQELSSGPAWLVLDELRRSLPGKPSVRLLLVADDLEPAAFGIGRWTIVIPQRAISDLSHDELRALLAHELAHLVRGDSLWLGVSRAVCSCLAFQPLNHLARREWQRAAEFLCDRWAVDRTGTPLALARCLTEVAGWRLAACRSNLTLAATGRKTGLVDRIELLLDARQPPEIGTQRRSWLLAAAGISLAFVVWCAPAVHFATAGTPATPDEQTKARIVNPAGPGDNLAVSSQVPRSPGPIANNPALPQASDVVTLLATLDENIAGLGQELFALEPLLRAQNDLPAARPLADRIQKELQHLKQRRENLKAFSNR